MTSPTAPMHRAPEPAHAMWADKAMPDGERRLLTTLSAGVWLIALAMNVSHVYDHLGQKHIGIDDTRRAVLCLAPDVLLLIGVWKLRYRARSSVAWAMVGTGLGWLAWSALSTAQASPSAWVLAVAPIGVAVLTTLALEFKHAEEPAAAPTPSATWSKLEVEPDPATELEPPAPAFKPEPVSVEPPRKAAPKVDAKRPAPSREQARNILGALHSLDDKSDAELAREHGGSDTYWRLRKKDYRAALANLSAEAGAL